jgi:hypothetical protein
LILLTETQEDKEQKMCHMLKFSNCKGCSVWWGEKPIENPKKFGEGPKKLGRDEEDTVA